MKKMTIYGLGIVLGFIAALAGMGFALNEGKIALGLVCFLLGSGACLGGMHATGLLSGRAVTPAVFQTPRRRVDVHVSRIELSDGSCVRRGARAVENHRVA